MGMGNDSKWVATLAGLSAGRERLTVLRVMHPIALQGSRPGAHQVLQQLVHALVKGQAGKMLLHERGHVGRALRPIDERGFFNGLCFQQFEFEQDL